MSEEKGVETATIKIRVVVRKEKTNETPDWQTPSAQAVVAFIKERVVGVETDDGWVVEEVTAKQERPAYDPEFGDDKECAQEGCKHMYYRHFDTYDAMKPVGCKYCPCEEFVPSALTRPKASHTMW